MTTKPWPKNVNHGPIMNGDCFVYSSIEQDRIHESVEDSTACKHGSGSCEICGTTDRRDVLHTTKNGRGSVGRL